MNHNYPRLACLASPPGYGKNRKEILSYVKNPQTGKFEYVSGLVETVDGTAG